MEKQNEDTKYILLVLLMSAVYPIVAILFHLANLQNAIVANQTAIVSMAALLLIVAVAIYCIGTVVVMAQPRYNW